jgi:single-strand DNA-binding protein
MNLNRVILIGNLTRDPEMRTISSGQSVCNFGMATNRTWTDQAGAKQQATEFHNIVAWRRLAEICGQYLKKGSLVMIEGRLQTRSWQAQDGTNRYRTEIVAENMQMGPRSGQAGPASPDASQGGGDFSPSASSATAAADESIKSAEDNTPTINLDEQGNPIEEGSPPTNSEQVENPGEPPSTTMPF